MRRFWSGEGGAREVLVISYPLILSHMSFTIQTFVDRIFLTWYSPEAIAGSMTALFVAWVVMGLFLGTGEYVVTFVAQYTGAARPERIGPSVWQGIYFSILAGLCLAALSPLVGPVFSLAGHAPAVRACEVTYASIIIYGACPTVMMATLSTFFSGRGETLTVLAVNLLVTAVNVVLDYLWIFGHAGFPRAGVAGAALATVVSQAIGAGVFFGLMMRSTYRTRFATLAGRAFDWPLFRHLLRYGLPNGLQYTGEIFAFAIFMVLVGRIGTDELAASSLAFNLNMLVFMPMIGMGVGVSSLVGRYLGENRPEIAERSTWSAFRMSMLYMTLCGAAYVFAPRLLLSPYAAGADAASFARLEPLAVALLRFVALYSIFDMMNLIFASGLKGAGDTVYPLGLSVFLSWAAMLIPAYIACVRMGGGVLIAWTAASAYIILLGLLIVHRFRKGRWKSLRVIEPRTGEIGERAAGG